VFQPVKRDLLQQIEWVLVTWNALTSSMLLIYLCFSVKLSGVTDNFKGNL